MKNNIINLARQVINIESNGLKIVSKSINNNFVKAINILKKTKGKIILTGIGKSGIIANKISSTLSSTGSSSQFIHPSEASHGDLGTINKKDSIIAFTFSGKTNELNETLSQHENVHGIWAFSGDAKVRSSIIHSTVFNLKRY